MNCTMDEQEQDYMKLQQQNKDLENILSTLQKKFDENTIVTADLKYQLTLLKENENKYFQEIHDLQNSKEDGDKNLKDKLKSLQNDLICADESFELKLFKKDEEILNLQEELANFPNAEIEESKEESEEMFNINLNLEIRLQQLIDNEEETKLQLRDIQKENEVLSNNNQTLTESLVHLQQTLQNKSEEIAHSYKLLHEIEEEHILTNNELKCLSDKSENLVVEGSIFSEVNNRRLGLKESISKFEVNSKNLINTKLNVQKGISKFRSNHLKLENLLKSEMKDIKYDTECLFVYYRSRNTVLEELVDIYNHIVNEKLKLVNEGLPSDGLQYLHKYVDDIEESIKKWKESQNTRRLSLFMISSDLRDSNLKLIEENLRSTQLKNKVVELETNFENFQLKQKENIEPTNLNVTQDVLANLPVLDNKECKIANIEKKVAFAADIPETKSSSNHQVKRGKVMKFKTVHID